MRFHVPFPRFPVVMFLFTLAVPLPLFPAEATTPMKMGLNTSDMKFAVIPGTPACSTGAVVNGDPATGPSIIMARATSGCVFPWHWHTPGEHLMIVSGIARVETRDGGSLTLRAGGFSMLPSHHVHQFTCVKTCALYVYSDAAFDMHFVDSKDQEITADEAMKSSRPKK